MRGGGGAGGESTGEEEEEDLPLYGDEVDRKMGWLSGLSARLIGGTHYRGGVKEDSGLFWASLVVGCKVNECVC